MDFMIAVAYLVAGVAAVWHTVDQLALLRWARAARRRTVVPEPPLPSPAPFVVVQLPLYNEPRVVERLLDAVARLDYPAGRWVVQVLDDSTDHTPDLVEAWIARHGRVPVSHVRRRHRDGFKAGALSAGLALLPQADYVAILDADFVVPVDFLRRCVARFAPDVAVVQGAWGHLNPDENLFTIAGSVMMDNHFQLEQAGRQASGSFLAFNGTAGVISVAAIRAVGGWRSDTLTEDFDLSLRLQLAGWRVRYDPSIVVPAEVPASPAAMRLQQHRWMRGVAQNSRRFLSRLAGSRLRLRTRLHLASQVFETGTFAAVGAMVLLSPLVAWRVGAGAIPAWVGWNLPLLVAFAGLLPVYLFSLRPRVPSPGLRVWRYLQFLLVSASLAIHNALAVVAGWTGRPAGFERTPKAGAGGGVPTPDETSGRRPRRATRTLEAILGVLVGVSILVIGVSNPSLIGYLWPSLGWVAGTILLLPRQAAGLSTATSPRHGPTTAGLDIPSHH